MGQRFPPAVGSAVEMLRPFCYTRVPPETSLSCFQLQAWWRGTMVRRNLGPYQNLRKAQEKQLLNQKSKKEKPAAKKKTR